MRLRLLNAIVESKYREYVENAIGQIESLGPECMLSGDERYKDVWEEFASQIQGQHSFFFDAYEDTIRRICLEVVRHLPESETRLLWLWTDAFLERDDEREPGLDEMVEDVCEEVYSRLCDRAADEELDEEEDDSEDDGYFPCDGDVLGSLQRLAAFVETLVVPTKVSALTIQGVARLLSFLRRLPEVTDGVSGTLTIGISEPETRYYSINVSEGYLDLRDGGAVYDPAVGSDSYSTERFCLTLSGVDKGSELDVLDWIDKASSLLAASGTVEVEGFDDGEDIHWDEDSPETLDSSRRKQEN